MRTIIDMVKHDGLKMFYRGLFPLFAGQLMLWSFMGLAFFCEAIRSRYTPLICGSVFLLGCAAAHPWYVVGMRVQYNRFHPAGSLHREGYKNSLKGILYIKQTQGLSGLWRGFVPGLCVYTATQWNDVKRMVFMPLIRQYQGWRIKKRNL